MRSEDFQNGVCPYLSEVARAASERRDLVPYASHIATCVDCQAVAEAIQKNQQQSSSPSIWSLLGTLVMWKVGRGIMNAVSQTIHNAGGGTPFWFKPKDNPAGDDTLKKIQKDISDVSNNVEKMRNPDNLFGKRW